MLDIRKFPNPLCSLFDSQAQCDQIIEYYASKIRIPQHQLMITYNSKGLVHGNIRIYTDSCNFMSCNCNPDQGMLIPSIVYEREENVRVQNPQRTDGVPELQHTVIVVEKATVFQRLIASKFVENSLNRVTIVSGGGYPDLPTRRFLALCHEAQFRIVGIADCDPFGIEIMAVYKWGSFTHMREKELLAAPSLEWVGLKPEDLEDNPDLMNAGVSKLPLLPIDKRKLNSVIRRLQTIQGDESAEWLAQAQLMSSVGSKCELEVLHVRQFVMFNYLK
jgi:meiotic recombination protein SPO11